jgi:hypothetical protein
MARHSQVFSSLAFNVHTGADDGDDAYDGADDGADHELPNDGADDDPHGEPGTLTAV